MRHARTSPKNGNRHDGIQISAAENAYQVPTGTEAACDAWAGAWRGTGGKISGVLDVSLYFFSQRVDIQDFCGNVRPWCRTGRCRRKRERNMIKTVSVSGNKKTGPIAVTYRSGEHSVYGTCPKSCALNPQGEHAADLIDTEYLQAVRKAVPRRGKAWTYSHFPAHLLPLPAKGETVINASCDTMEAAIDAVRKGRPAVYAAPSGTNWPVRHEGVRFVRCPAETVDTVNCSNCGGGRPLCARGDRDYVIVFVAHGSGARFVGTDTQGGCYGNGGPVRMQWNATKKAGSADDAAAVVRFAEGLPPGSFLRHHVVGDLGRG